MNALNVKSFFLDELFDHLIGKNKLPFNSIVLTFDDGYRDNFTFVFPLLKKYKIKATIWVNPQFVNNDDAKIYPTLEDYWNNKISLEKLNKIDGYLNWEEMRLMEKSGYVDIQSHTLTHTRYPISNEIVDFVNPTTRIDWLYWNLYPHDKPNFITNPKHKIPLGYPIYKNEKGNIAKIVEETGELSEELIKYVKDNGESAFFNNSGWKDKLYRVSEEIKKNKYNLYKTESEEEYVLRIKHELKESKIILEEKLCKTINHVCWPFGGWNEITINIADQCGYLTNTARGQKNIFKKAKKNRVDRIALDNAKYQNLFFYPYSLYKIYKYKL
jgi:peptidoglycan/xylan/chitin deacetylase (PgdA/CDA1 family)